MYRSYIAQNKFLVVLDEINQSSPSKVQPLKTLSEYLSSPQKREIIVKQLDEKIAGNISVDNEIFAIVAATIYLKEQNEEAAFRILHTADSIEALAMIVSILLKLDRVDLARKKLKEMQDKDDDHTLTQLVQAWINIATVSTLESFI